MRLFSHGVLGLLALAGPSFASNKSGTAAEKSVTKASGSSEPTALETVNLHLEGYKTDASGVDHKSLLFPAMWELYKSESDLKAGSVEAFKGYDKLGGLDSLLFPLLRSVLCADLAILIQKEDEFSAAALKQYNAICSLDRKNAPQTKGGHMAAPLLGQSYVAKSALEQRRERESEAKYQRELEEYNEKVEAKKTAAAAEKGTFVHFFQRAGEVLFDHSLDGPSRQERKRQESAKLDRNIAKVRKPVQPTFKRVKVAPKFATLKQMENVNRNDPDVWGSRSKGASVSSFAGTSNVFLVGEARRRMETLGELAVTAKPKHHERILLALARLQGESVPTLTKRYLIPHNVEAATQALENKDSDGFFKLAWGLFPKERDAQGLVNMERLKHTFEIFRRYDVNPSVRFTDANILLLRSVICGEIVHKGVASTTTDEEWALYMDQCIGVTAVKAEADGSKLAKINGALKIIGSGPNGKVTEADMERAAFAHIFDTTFLNYEESEDPMPADTKALLGHAEELSDILRGFYLACSETKYYHLNKAVVRLTNNPLPAIISASALPGARGGSGGDGSLNPFEAAESSAAAVVMAQPAVSVDPALKRALRSKKQNNDAVFAALWDAYLRGKKDKLEAGMSFDLADEHVTYIFDDVRISALRSLLCINMGYRVLKGELPEPERALFNKVCMEKSIMKDEDGVDRFLFASITALEEEGHMEDPKVQKLVEAANTICEKVRRFGATKCLQKDSQLLLEFLSRLSGDDEEKMQKAALARFDREAGVGGGWVPEEPSKSGKSGGKSSKTNVNSVTVVPSAPPMMPGDAAAFAEEERRGKVPPKGASKSASGADKTVKEGVPVASGKSSASMEKLPASTGKSTATEKSPASTAKSTASTAKPTVSTGKSTASTGKSTVSTGKSSASVDKSSASADNYSATTVPAQVISPTPLLFAETGTRNNNYITGVSISAAVPSGEESGPVKGPSGPVKGPTGNGPIKGPTVNGPVKGPAVPYKIPSGPWSMLNGPPRNLPKPPAGGMSKPPAGGMSKPPAGGSSSKPAGNIPRPPASSNGSKKTGNRSSAAADSDEDA